MVEDVVLESIAAEGTFGHLGYAWWEPGNPENTFDGWTVIVYPTPAEVKGPHRFDGAKFVSGFALDLGKLVAVFGNVDALIWRSPARYNGNLDGPGVDVQGTFAGKRVRLRVYSLPPSDEECSYYADPTTGRAWEQPG